MASAQILTADQMRAAEQALFDAGMSVSELMEVAAGGAAEWIRRLAAGCSVTVLCGPGNNGGDGYVIARHLREAGNAVQVVAPTQPKTDAAKAALKAWGGSVHTSGGSVDGEVFVDCLFGTGLTRPLSGEHALLLRDLAERHGLAIAVDLPSGVASNDGSLLNERLPTFDVTLALGAWKFAHWMLPARELLGMRRLVPIGIEDVEGAAQLNKQPVIKAPDISTHKYKRGFGVVVEGEMAGAPRLAAEATLRSGAGYVKLVGDTSASKKDNPSLVIQGAPLDGALCDDRISAVLVGPGLGRSQTAKQQLNAVLKCDKPTVLDADALMLLTSDMLRGEHSLVATPHDGELDALCRSFSVIAEGRRARALAVARAAQMIVIAKGPDTFIACPDGRLVVGRPASSWLSIAGSGDVLAGIVMSRLATGASAFQAACDAVWLHGEAARHLEHPFTPQELARTIPKALERCL